MEDYVRIFDTTLRDGEQSPGATMTADEKLRIARKLDAMRVDVVEAGFPAASPGELRSVQRVAEALEYSEVAALCRTREGDIRAAWEAVSVGKKPRIHVFIATSDLHMEHKLGMTRQQVLEQIRAGVSLASSLCERVEFSAEDATRSDVGFLQEAFALAVECGATVLNIPDTVGYTMPSEYFNIVTKVREAVGDRAIISTHCHNDLGLAVANSLAAVEAGARQIECCVNGIGERAGNAALEEVVMALRTRQDLTGIQTNVDTRQLLSVSRMVSEATGLSVQWNKAIVGRNAFAHESGIHQHGVLSKRETYEIMHPEDVGFNASNLVLGKHSGKHALRARLEDLGYRLDDEQMKVVFGEFKKLCDRKKVIYDEDLHALVNTGFGSEDRRYELVSVTFRSGSDIEPEATATLRIDDKEVTQTAKGDGPVNASFEAIKKCVGIEELALEEYRIEAISGGSDAQGRVHLLVKAGDFVASGDATHTDVVVASARALVDALNHYALQQQLYESGELSRAKEVKASGWGV
jgi:2-isopropylmalate synthase